MRLCYFFAIATGQQVVSIWQQLSIPCSLVEISGTLHFLNSGSEFLTRAVAVAVAHPTINSVTGSWDIYQVIPVEDDLASSQAFWRVLDAAQKSEANTSGDAKYMLGPWTAVAFDQLGWIGGSLLYEQESDLDEEGNSLPTSHTIDGAVRRLPWCVAGDDPAQLATAEYNGT